jgi:hypothetical protein
MGSSNLQKPQRRSFPSECEVLMPHRPGAQDIARIIVNTLAPTAAASSQPYLSKLLNTIESYYHPSNSGKWTDTLAILLHRLSYFYAQRVASGTHNMLHLYSHTDTERTSEKCKTPVELRLSKENDAAFVASVLPVAVQSFYSKRDDLSLASRNTFGFLIRIQSISTNHSPIPRDRSLEIICSLDGQNLLCIRNTHCCKS